MAKNDNDTKVFKAAKKWESSFPMVVDKTDESWVVMGFLFDWEESGRPEVTLRVRIRRCLGKAVLEDRPFFGVRVGDLSEGGPFIELGEGAPCGTCEGEFSDLAAGVSDDGIPGIWTEQFREMLQRWAVMSAVLEPEFSAVCVADGALTSQLQVREDGEQ